MSILDEIKFADAGTVSRAQLEQIAVWIDNIEKLDAENGYTEAKELWALLFDIRKVARGQA